MKFFHQLFQAEQPQTPGQKVFFYVLQLFVIGYTVSFVWEWGSYIQRIHTVVLPLGIAQYIDVSVLFTYNLSLVNAAAVTLLLVFGFFQRSRYAYFTALLLFHLQYVARYSLGEISHGSNMVGMSLMALGLAALIYNTWYDQYRFTLGFLWFFIGLGYTSAALCKLVAAGFDWTAGQHMWLWMNEVRVDMLAKHGYFSFSFLQEAFLNHWWLATAVLLFGWLSEALGWLLWWKVTRPLITTALVAMHLGIAATMNILFIEYIYELILIGYPWPHLLDKLFARSTGYFSLLQRFFLRPKG